MPPAFKDDSTSDEKIDKLLTVLAAGNAPSQELLGAFVYNARYGDESGLFDNPISIDPYDQQRLSELSLVTTLNLSVNRRQNYPVASLTALGVYVTKHAVLTTPQAGADYLPRLDTDQLYSKLS